MEKSQSCTESQSWSWLTHWGCVCVFSFLFLFLFLFLSLLQAGSVPLQKTSCNKCFKSCSCKRWATSIVPGRESVQRLHNILLRCQLFFKAAKHQGRLSGRRWCCQLLVPARHSWVVKFHLITAIIIRSVPSIHTYLHTYWLQGMKKLSILHSFFSHCCVATRSQDLSGQVLCHYSRWNLSSKRLTTSTAFTSSWVCGGTSRLYYLRPGIAVRPLRLAPYIKSDFCIMSFQLSTMLV